MQRTISAMVGKGSVNHNSRKFKAENVDGERTHLNIDYCSENIKKVYHELFDEALELKDLRVALVGIPSGINGYFPKKNSLQK